MRGELHCDVWINEQVKIHQPPLPSGEGWGEGISNEPLPADPSIFESLKTIRLNAVTLMRMPPARIPIVYG